MTPEETEILHELNLFPEGKYIAKVVDFGDPKWLKSNTRMLYIPVVLTPIDHTIKIFSFLSGYPSVINFIWASREFWLNYGRTVGLTIKHRVVLDRVYLDPRVDWNYSSSLPLPKSLTKDIPLENLIKESQK